MLPNAENKPERTNQIMKKEIRDKHSSPHYKWGDNCDSWVLADKEGLSVKHESMPVGTKERAHFHHTAQQFFFVLKGKATFYIEDERVIVQEQSGVMILPNTIHFVANETNDPLDFLVISQPSTNNDRTTIE
jgi:mannose-6-phosphate isomerase-like protein (cupin superfamily)